MRKLFFAGIVILFLGFLFVLTPTLAKIIDSPFLAGISKIVQNILPSKELQPVSPEEGEEFVDPRDVKQVLREIKDMKRELKRFAKEFKKLPNSQDDLNQVNNLLTQVTDFENRINQGVNLREVIQEFRDEQIWEDLNKFRAKIEIPKEMKYWNKDIKRLEKMLKQKKYQDLGFDLEKTKNKLDETKTSLAKIQEYYNNGDLESAIEEFDDLRQDFHPGEILSALQRTQELMSRAKKIKDAEVQNQIKEMFDEVVSSFNEGEYRIARELIDENFNEISQVIYKAYSVGKKGNTKEGFFEMTENFEQTLKNKADEKKAKLQEIRQKTEEAPQPITPQIPPSLPSSATGGGASVPLNSQPASQE